MKLNILESQVYNFHAFLINSQMILVLLLDNKHKGYDFVIPGVLELANHGL